MTCVSAPKDRPPIDTLPPLRHDKDCPHCHGSSVGDFVIDGQRTVIIPCPCGRIEPGEPYKPLEELRRIETPTERLRKKS